MSFRSRRFVWFPTLMALSFMAALSGCGGNPHPVNPDIAQQTLKTTLDAWKSGQTVESMKQAKPAVVVQDMDWMGGAKLVDYQILDGSKAVDANLQAKVKLKLKDDKDVESEKTVSYLVGTSPALTVFRDMFH